MKKRILALFSLMLVFMLCFSMLACSDDAGSSVPDADKGGGMGSDSEGSSNVVTDASNRKIVYTVFLGIDTKNVDSVYKTLTEKASALGGYVESSDQYYEDGKSSWCNIVYRIPTEKLDEFLAAAEKSGTVSDKSVLTDDITKKYVSSQAQKQALVERKAQLEALLEEDVSVADKVDLIEQISSVNAQIMQIDLMLSGYDSDLAFSTVTVEIDEEIALADVLVPLVIVGGLVIAVGGGIAAVIVIIGKKKKVNF